jgi:hypothetical protein
VKPLRCRGPRVSRHPRDEVIEGGAFLAKPGFFPDPSIYELVHELRFENGRLIEATDRSEETVRDRSPRSWKL